MLMNVTDNIVLEQEISFFTVSGDPGCDGYNVESVCVLESILAVRADLHLVLGDMVPTGREHWFRQFESLTARFPATPVYCLMGNHDRPEYGKFAGKRDYFIKAPGNLIIILDNANRAFSEATMDFFEEALKIHADAAKHIFVAFHIPPPSVFSGNSVPLEEWAKVAIRLAPHRAKVRAIFAGHVHSAYSFEIDGFPVIVTGGGGARLDPVDNCYFPVNRHHFVRVESRDGEWRFYGEMVVPGKEGNAYGTEGAGAAITSGLNESISGECQAYQRYMLFAERAQQGGRPGLAKLFRAAADSERHHAANMLLALGGIGTDEQNIADSIGREGQEWRVDYARRLEAANESRVSGRAAIAYECALKAEKVHHHLFEQALESLRAGEDVPVKRYFTCGRCGFTHEGDAPPPICPACGTDHNRFFEVE